MNSDLDTIVFAENPEPRCACLLVLDVSGSMEGERIEALNQGLQVFQDALQKDELASKRLEVGIVTFGGMVQTIQDFVTADQFQAPRLGVCGDTPMGAAVQQALDMLEARKKAYNDNGIAYYRPWLFLITDGAPTDTWVHAARRAYQADQNKRVAFFTVGVTGADLSVLAQFSPRTPNQLKGVHFQEMFVWLSRSTQAVAHSVPGDQVALDPPKDWVV